MELYHSKIIDDIMKNITFEEKLKVRLQMEDYSNWDNGDYKGDVSETVRIVMEELKEEDLDKLKKEL